MINKHIMHLDDYLITQKPLPTKIDSVSVKYDGAPSIVCGNDPEDDKFFISTKSVFNKTPIVYKSIDQLNTISNIHLRYKLCQCFDVLQHEQIKGIIQGDLLFTAEDIREITIDKKRYTTFHPNTLVYAIHQDYQTAKKIRSSRIGVAWHTYYRGENLRQLSIDPSKANQKIEFSDNVFSVSESYNNLNLDLHFGCKQLDIEGLEPFIESYITNIIKSNQYLSLREHLKTILNKHINQYKTSVKKQQYYDLLDKLTSNDIDYYNSKVLELMGLKERIINKIDLHPSLFKCFIKKNDQYTSVFHEGYVLNHDNTMLKLVHRFIFSRANFSDNVDKGFSY